MAARRPTRNKDRKAKTPATIPSRFVPQFFENDVDKRQIAVKAIKRRYQELKDDVGCDSHQKDLLIQRAVFLSIVLETLEVEAIKTQSFEKLGVWIQGCNSLSGLLTKLGLAKTMKDAQSLQEIVATTKSNGNGKGRRRTE